MNRITTAAVGLAAASFLAPAMADVDPNAGMLRYPDIGPDHIVFSYGNDLWIVPRAGGVAAPLASPPGPEQYPKYSADGSSIAFVGNYEGNRDLYKVPSSGGLAERLTHHPASEALCDWTPDGHLLFSSNGDAALARRPALFRITADGGLPQSLPVPYGANGAISADGTWLAYTPHERDRRTWKRYRGGMASDVWLFNLKTNESRRVTEWEGTDSFPMWNGSTLYYLSDAGPEHRLNLWAYDPKTEQHRQVTEHETYDVKWPSMGPGPDGKGEIVFQNGPDLCLLDLDSGTTTIVDVTIPGDRPTLRRRVVDSAEFIQGGDISSTGKRAVLEARGDVWTAPAENGIPRNLTRTEGAAERDPSWSPDGRWVAYFSDASGEYELNVTQSDGKGETRQLTSDGGPFKYGPLWSPDSSKILFSDKTGAMHLVDVEGGDVKKVDRNPWDDGPVDASWSHDSRWIAYSKPGEDIPHSSIWLYDVEGDEATQVTSEMFDDTDPAFDRKGDYLFFVSKRSFTPSYSALPTDTTFVYRDADVLVAVPLRDDIESPWAPKIDEETWGDDEDEDEDEDGDEDDGDEDEDDGDEDEDDGDEDEDEGDEDDDDAATPADDVTGVWKGTAQTPDGPMDFSIDLALHEDGTVTGSLSAGPFSGAVSGTYDGKGGLELTVSVEGGLVIVMDLEIEGNNLEGMATADGTDVEMTAARSISGGTDDEADEEAAERVEIVLADFERRAMRIPVPVGNFGNLGVNSKNELLYVRVGTSGEPSIKLYDINDEDAEEKNVAVGAGGFAVSSDGKKLLIARGDKLAIQDASAGAASKNVDTSGMTASIDPREEWRQIFHDAWRINRDFFYVENMHGVDWDAIRDQYAAMLDDCVSREDVSFVIGEMIAELNVGHAYYFGGDIEEQPSVNVGLLGADFEIADGAYRIARIHEGAAWDLDARGPLSQPGVDVEAGDFLLAVNGIPVDTTMDPWAAFVDSQGRETVLTVSSNATMDDEAREVVVKPIGVGADRNLRYRSWIEQNRSYVAERSSGRVGYIYVPNTGVDGQNDLIRQFFGQSAKDALIIDERWNGGGQIPTRFIELLNRPRTNYWARRDGNDWAWPPDSHQGPKCMLINGLAGSGGDMFPALFRQAGLGKLIGTRTWGGLVGLSGNPGLIDGGYTAVPTFGYYETDGTWGIEGHGVDPDIEIIDDPAAMVAGGDPQLDFAIDHMLEEIEGSPYVPPKRPAAPVRSGMGIAENDK